MSLPRLRDEAKAVAAALDPEVLTGSDAASAVQVCAEMERVVAGMRMLLARRVDATKAWQGTGERSAARWLARQSGTSVGEAGHLLETAKRLEGLDATEGAVRRGELSPQQARAVTEAAVADPAAEATLLAAAQSESLGELRDRSLATKAAALPDDVARHAAIRRSRFLRHRCEADGAFVATLRTTPDAGAVFLTAIDEIRQSIFREARAKGLRERPEAYDADAAIELARRYLADGEDQGDGLAAALAGSVGGEHAVAGAAPVEICSAAGDEAGAVSGRLADDHGPPRSREDGPPPRKRTKRRRRSSGFGSRAKVIVRIDHSALVRGQTIAGETSEIAGLGPVPVSVVREMMSDAFLAAVVTKGVDVCTVAHLGRKFTAHQQTALEFRDPTCTVIGCGISARLENDHRTGWAVTNTTAVSDADRLCDHHHRLKTLFGYRLEAGSGKRRLMPPVASASVSPR